MRARYTYKYVRLWHFSTLACQHGMGYTCEKISIDAEIAKLGLPEDRRIHAKTVDDVASIARKILEEER